MEGRVYTRGPKREVGVGVYGDATNVDTCEPRRLGAEDESRNVNRVRKRMDLWGKVWVSGRVEEGNGG